MANLLFIKCVSLWQILSHDSLRIRQHAYNEDWHSGLSIQSVQIHSVSPWQSERQSVGQVHQFRGPEADTAFM